MIVGNRCSIPKTAPFLTEIKASTVSSLEVKSLGAFTDVSYFDADDVHFDNVYRGVIKLQVCLIESSYFYTQYRDRSYLINKILTRLVSASKTMPKLKSLEIRLVKGLEIDKTVVKQLLQLAVNAQLRYFNLFVTKANFDWKKFDTEGKKDTRFNVHNRIYRRRMAQSTRLERSHLRNLPSACKDFILESVALASEEKGGLRYVKPRQECLWTDEVTFVV